MVIVTNGQLGWVETSAKRFMPRVLGYLKKQNITIISAQFTFRKQKQIRPDDPQSWKDSAFEQLVREGVKKPCVKTHHQERVCCVARILTILAAGCT